MSASSAAKFSEVGNLINSVPNSEITYSNAVGLGSTNTAVIKWNTSENLVGTDITYSGISAANGSWFNIVTTGIYAVSFSFGDSAATTTVAIAVDTTGSALTNGGTTLAGNPRTLAYSDGIRARAQSMSSTSYVQLGWTGHLTAGAKIYLLSNSGAAGNANCLVTIARVA